jgi:glycosyltransferase involved in cell wall biosynthesis
MNKFVASKIRICLIGHPFAPIGRGEDVRSIYFALRSAGISPKVVDIYGFQEPDSGSIHQEIKKNLTKEMGDINIFIINGDEIESVLKHLSLTVMPSGKNIICPAWELSCYPEEWAALLNKFDEIWAQSKFTYNCLCLASKKPVRHISLPSEVKLDSLLPRRYFEIPNEEFTFLFSFDFRSFISRKNPFSVLRCFRQLLQEHKSAKPMLIIKTQGGNAPKKLKKHFDKLLDQLGNAVLVIDREMTDNEVRNLIRVCDCYISLHRSEGFGRGMAEAMHMGKPVIGTRYSGNLDFMNDSNSLLVNYDLIDVGENDYPHGSGQKWANPNEEHALEHMRKIVTDNVLRINIGTKAQKDARSMIGYKAVGLKMKIALDEMAGDLCQ